MSSSWHTICLTPLSSFLSTPPSHPIIQSCLSLSTLLLWIAPRYCWFSWCEVVSIAASRCRPPWSSSSSCRTFDCISGSRLPFKFHFASPSMHAKISVYFEVYIHLLLLCFAYICSLNILVRGAKPKASAQKSPNAPRRPTFAAADCCCGFAAPLVDQERNSFFFVHAWIFAPPPPFIMLSEPSA